MEETPIMKTCGQCGAIKALTEDFGVNAASPDGRRNICRTCRADNRSAEKMRDVNNLKNHERVVKAAKKALATPEGLSANSLHKFQMIVDGDEKKRAKLQAKIQEAHKAEEDARIAQAASPSLARVQAIGSALFGSKGELLEVSERPAQLAKFKLALTELTDEPVDALARKYVSSVIDRLEEMVSSDAERETERTAYDLEVVDGRACQDAADAVRDKFAGLFGEGVATQHQHALKTEFQIFRATAQTRAKEVKPDERTATGASCKKIAQRILEELTAMASRLGKAGTEVGPQQSLANAQSFDWGQATSAHAMRAYVRQLTAKLDEARATMTPKEYEKKYLQLPVAPKEEIVIWKVRLLNGREEWFWPSGKIVRRGVDVASAEVVKDALHGWVIAPSPVGAELDDENKPVGKLECVQEDNGQFVYKVVDPDERWEQGNDGLWTKVAGSDSPWSKPEKIVFKVGPAQPDAEHSEFRLGNWFTKAECDAAEQGPTLDKPPVILPPLERTKADSIAVEPSMTKEELAKWSRQPNRWKRHEERMKQEKETEQALLRGKFIWNFESTAVKA